MANTIKTSQGIEVYESKIHELVDEYISDLDNPDDIKTNRGLFTGMIKYLYMQYFKHNSLDYNDIELLDNIFNIYTSLCYRYGKRPTLLNFSIMIGISMDTLNSWKREETRGYIYFDSMGDRIYDFPAWRLHHPNEDYRQEISSSHSETVKKWLKECESTLVDGAIESNSIGCIFALKANYGYVETAQRIEISTKDQVKSVDQIVAEHAPELLQDSGQLELPDGDF